MLFNSYIFIFLFLPIVLVGFYLIGEYLNKRLALSWLVIASLLFYAWWNPAYLVLIVASIIFNYFVGRRLYLTRSKLLLFVGVGVNLASIGYFKYANFFVDSINVAFDLSFNLERILLPLAISFFTFQQITFLVDAYRDQTKEYDFLHYCLFVTFFPQLIAGPIVHHKEMMPQFRNDAIAKLDFSHLSVGISLFALGLFKKVVLADNIAVYATPVFASAENSVPVTLVEAWSGALAYTFQLYFDFSGYSDMAIGLARMFGIVLPANFFSPYKAQSIIEFWRRWHITLSRFLRDYLYFSLGGNRRGIARRYVNLMLTMLLGGLWHGAGWTFIIWGGLHGFYLCINHAWRAFAGDKRVSSEKDIGGKEYAKLLKLIGVLLTFFAVVIAWVMFRAESVSGALHLYHAMLGKHGISPPGGLEPALINMLILMFLIVWLMPNSLEWLKKETPALDMNSFTGGEERERWITWQPTYRFVCITALLLTVAVMYIQQESEFLYFQF